ncbi:MAG: acylphosphatase [Myxococcota bacterium]
MITARRYLVSGIVQGVGYRDFVVRQASGLGLLGWVRNLYDERVEVWAEGSAEAVALLRVQLEEGPRYAEVRAVEEVVVGARGATDFRRLPSAEGPELLR